MRNQYGDKVVSEERIGTVCALHIRALYALEHLTHSPDFWNLHSKVFAPIEPRGTCKCSGLKESSEGITKRIEHPMGFHSLSEGLGMCHTMSLVLASGYSHG